MPDLFRTNRTHDDCTQTNVRGIKSAEKCKTVQAIRIKNLKSKNKYLRILKISQNNNKKMKKKQYNIKVDT